MKWYQKHTPSLRQAVQNEDIRTVKRLLSHWCRVNIKVREKLYSYIEICESIYGQFVKEKTTPHLSYRDSKR